MNKIINKNIKKVIGPKILCILLLMSINYTPKVNCGALIDAITKGIELPQPKTPEIAFGEVGKAEQQIKELKNELTKLKEKDEEFKNLTNKKITNITNEQKKVNLLIPTAEKKDFRTFLENKSEILNETYQDIKDTQSLRKKLPAAIDEHIKILESYIKDPEFATLIGEFVEQRKFYSFDDLQKINEMVLGQEEKIKLLEEQKHNTQTELESREQTSEITKENYDKKVKELDNFKKSSEKITSQAQVAQNPGFNKDQKLDILTAQENLLKNKKELNKYRITEVKHKLELTKTNLFLENLKLNIFKKAANNIKTTIKISESDILADKAALDKQKIESYKTISKLKSEIVKISKKYDIEKKELEKASKDYKVKITPEFDQWEVNPITKQDFTKIINVGKLNEIVSLSAKEKELYEAQIAKNEEELSQLKINVELKETFYNVETGKLISEKDISGKMKEYNKIKLDVVPKINRNKEKINYTKENLKNKNKALENLNKLKTKLEKLVPEKTSAIYNNIFDADAKIKQQIKDMQDSIDIYENIISINNKMEKQTSFILSSLEQLVGKWYRPEYAIKFDKVPNIIPELKIFTSDLFSYFKKFSLPDFFNKIKMSFPKKMDFLSFLFLLIISITFLILFRISAPKMRDKLLEHGKKNSSPGYADKPDNLVKFFSYSIAFVLDFSIKYFFSIFVWLITFFLISTIMIPDKYVTIMFYLISIIYFIYITNRFLNHFWAFNKKYNVLTFIEQKYQKRIITVIAIIVYSTITIQFFRKAFELGIYFQSELPVVLSALNWIIGQLALILLITKELIKKIIPKKWNLTAEQYNNFYYFILLIAVIIIIMTNPYIGLGRLLLYAIQRLLLSMILIIGLLMLHKIGKSLSLKLFFKSDDETILSRFTYGKTIYGIYIIASFTILVCIGLLLGSYIWDFGISIDSIIDYITRTRWTIGDPGKHVSILSFFVVAGFLIAGLIFSAIINRFVLTKIFDLLLVETGVQVTISGVSKYIIITIFLMIGFYHVGLGQFIIWLIGILLAIGYIFKEVVIDFVYYFLILIQRPLKIGDFVRLKYDSQDIEGVVRRITPRAVILKYRNSESISIPNSKILTGSIVNFNYNTRYIAFEDISITVGYKYEPEKVRKIIMDILDAHQNILKSPRPIIRLDKFGDYGFTFSIRGFLSAQYTLDMWDIASDLRLEIAKALKENHIEIAVPISIWKSIE